MTEGRKTISTPLLPVHIVPSPFPLILTPSPTIRVEYGKQAFRPAPITTTMTTPTTMTTISDLTSQLTVSLKKPGRKTLILINKALSYLTPFESPLATVTSPSERRDLLTLLSAHRMILCPYIDVDRVESNLRLTSRIV